MRSNSIGVAVAALASLISVVSVAERLHEDRKTASHVVTGTVRGVYAEDSEYYRSFIVEIALENVEKGDGLKAEHVLYASCYQRKPGIDLAAVQEGADSAGHTNVPKRGEKIRAFLSHRRGRYEGVYPDWVDILQRRGERNGSPSGLAGGESHRSDYVSRTDLVGSFLESIDGDHEWSFERYPDGDETSSRRKSVFTVRAKEKSLPAALVKALTNSDDPRDRIQGEWDLDEASGTLFLTPSVVENKPSRRVKVRVRPAGDLRISLGGLQYNKMRKHAGSGSGSLDN
jgi:hypothetical protein